MTQLLNLFPTIIGLPLRLWRGRPRLFNNPVILREIVVRLRRKSSFGYLALFILIGAGVFLLLWPNLIQAYYGGRQGETRNLFNILNLIEGLLILLLAPLMSATAINLEYEQETWELVATTPLSLASIVLGKFLSSVFFLWLLMIAMIPVYSLSFPLGGISPQEIVFVFLMYTEVIVISGLIGLMCSTFFRRTVQSVTAAFFISFGYFLGFFAITLSFFLRGEGVFVWFVMLSSPLMVSIYYFFNDLPPTDMPGWLEQHFFLAHGLVVFCVILLLLFLCMIGLLSKKQKGYSLSSWIDRRVRAFSNKNPEKKPLNENQMISNNKNPVFVGEIKSLYGRYHIRQIMGIVVLFCLGGLIALRILVNTHYNSILGTDFFIWNVLLTPCFILPYAANCIRSEYDRKTWEMVSTTTLSSWQILKGKMWAGFYLYNWRLWSFYSVGFVLLVVYLIPDDPSILLQRAIIIGSVLLICYYSCFFFLSMGIALSTYFKKTINVYFASFAITALIIFLIPLIVGIIFEIFFPHYPRHTVQSITRMISPFFLVIEICDHFPVRYAGGLPRSWMVFFMIQLVWMTVSAILFNLLAGYLLRRSY